MKKKAAAKLSAAEIRKQFDGQDVYRCLACSNLWAHVGDFACEKCGSQDAEAVSVSTD
jgi:rRNA maturation endonuclease Nob1